MDSNRLTALLEAIAQRRPAADAAAPAVAAALADRLEAWALVHRNYLRKGFADPGGPGLWYGLHDALPDTTTLVVREGARVIATLTEVFDSPLGLPADDVFADQLAPLRRDGRRPCELISLASETDSMARGTDTLKALFRAAYVVAAQVEDATDLVMTVNPRHTAFYERIMLFSRLGEVRDYGKVAGAPAVLMRLDLRTAVATWRACHARGGGDAELYRFFCEDPAIPALRRSLLAARRPLAEAEIREWFSERRALIPRDEDGAERWRAAMAGTARLRIPA
jgi:hypothetical protein